MRCSGLRSGLIVAWLLALLGGSVRAQATVDAACQKVLDNWCNGLEDQTCVNALSSAGAELPLYARYDVAANDDEKQWRCYSPSSLTPDLSGYSNGTSYCTREQEILDVIADCDVNRTQIAVFTPGELGYPCIRIPSILLAGDNRTLLAFAECRNWTGDGCEPQGFEDARYNSTSNANRDLCMKTWSALHVIQRNAAQPMPVWDYQQNQLVLNFVQLTPGDNLQSMSKDFGQTWTPRGTCPSLDGSPGHAVAPNRLLFIGHHGAYQYDSVWYSDDGGLTYNVSKTNFTFMDEAQLVELPDGRVMANMRNNHINACKCRAYALSEDGGASFGAIQFADALVSPVCMASILRGLDGNVYFANPGQTSGRSGGMLRRSADGFAWNQSALVWPGSYAYSCLTHVPKSNCIGLLWETSAPDCTGDSCVCVFSRLSTADASFGDDC
ncbi:uncharacterized protein MONBRDRAFT_28502 [Monosiga brevicollis MX1]|uniref:Sialidase domain-containing protein n=1 Tax=Monosiga brevicollis TaxID=81824 RepID=A9V8C6_MONBE|nr:uncharacterized protein MONBRDRAFT_28502 [Monosiga brevicollis MX1]EDQ86314.1 predicted protein [Monosiga brevicollis MX1]|eukprot:XP_001748984.1 hypothetical protein [Monosiga brevicollis MX1]